MYFQEDRIKTSGSNKTHDIIICQILDIRNKKKNKLKSERNRGAKLNKIGIN